jgi:hypothetical protein
MSETVSCEGVGTQLGPGTSGTSSFDPPLSDIMIEVFERCQIRATELEPEHWQSCRRSMNLVQSRWSNRGINLWKVELVTTPLVQGQIDVPVDPNVINVLDVYRTITFGPLSTDTVLYPIDRSNYAAVPNKMTQGPPSSFWFARTQTPSMKLWPAVDGEGPYTLNYYVWRQMADAFASMGQTADLVQRFYEAYIAEVASHVSIKWQPARTQALTTYAVGAFSEAQQEDHEKVSTNMAPDLAGYFL